MPTKYPVDTWFELHPPSEKQRPRYEKFVEAAEKFQLAINEALPLGTAQDAVIARLRDLIQQVNHVIATDRYGEVEKRSV
jgi:hypothetical protein